MHIDIDILVYVIIAAILLGRLWAVLGTRNDNDTPRPNPFTPRPPVKEEAEMPSVAQQLATISRLLPMGPPPASLAGGLAQIEAIDKTFNEKQFLTEARTTFTKIVETYASGDLSSITSLLAPDLLNHFQSAADARKAEGQSAQSKVVRISDAEPIEARAESSQGFITVKFTSDQENILRDQSGAVIGGTEGRAETVTDIWVFGCDTTKLDAKWIVVETRG